MECGKEVGDGPVWATADAALFRGAAELRSLLRRGKTQLFQPPIKCPSPIDSDCDLLQTTVEEPQPWATLQLTQGATKANKIVVLGISLRWLGWLNPHFITSLRIFMLKAESE